MRDDSGEDTDGESAEGGDRVRIVREVDEREPKCPACRWRCHNHYRFVPEDADVDSGENVSDRPLDGADVGLCASCVLDSIIDAEATIDADGLVATAESG